MAANSTPELVDPADEARYEEELAQECANYHDDPYGWVQFAFPWGRGEMRGFLGLEKWQIRFFQDLGDEIRERGFDGFNTVTAIRMCVGSGHGIGKSCAVALLILFIMSTRPGCRGTVTANTSTQLSSRTVPELAKWKKRCLTGHWFKLSTGAGSMRMVANDDPEGWRVDFQTCRKENSEAFAGQHSRESTSFYIFDESSAIPDEIDEVANGGLTDGEPMYFKFGNRTRANGHFEDTFGRLQHRWLSQLVDSREVSFTNKEEIKRWAEDYGEDSNFFRVRVRGLCPSGSSQQFIRTDVVDIARRRRDTDVVVMPNEPIIMGVDVARHGDDWSTIYFRKGRDMALIAPHREEYTENITEFADVVADYARKHGVNAICIDCSGLGVGVADYLRRPDVGLGHLVHEVYGNAKSADRAYFNHRALMYGRLRKWLQHGRLPVLAEKIGEADRLREDLIQQEYVMDRSRQNIRLISKEDMKAAGMDSPDDSDGAAYTFHIEFAEQVPMEMAGHPEKASRDARMGDRGRFDPANRHDLDGNSSQPWDWDPVARHNLG